MLDKVSQATSDQNFITTNNVMHIYMLIDPVWAYNFYTYILCVRELRNLFLLLTTTSKEDTRKMLFRKCVRMLECVHRVSIK